MGAIVGRIPKSGAIRAEKPDMIKYRESVHNRLRHRPRSIDSVFDLSKEAPLSPLVDAPLDVLSGVS